MRWRLKLAYDGTDYAGWQVQPNGTSIQAVLQDQLRLVTGARLAVHGAGRTDAGVHARGQVCHFDADWPHPAHALLRAIGSRLPPSIQLLELDRVADDFHARYSATCKCYSYSYFEGRACPFTTRYCWSTLHVRLDEQKMQAAAQQLLGVHDFSAFAANPRDNRTGGNIRHLMQLDVLRAGPRITLLAVGDGFLFRMVRSLAGCLYDVGRGKLAPSEVPAILAARQRTARVITAPPQGLCMEWIRYEPSRPAPSTSAMS